MQRNEVKTAREILANVLREHGEQALREQGLDVRLSLGRATYDPSNNGGATFKLEIAQVNEETGDVMTKEALDFERHASRWNLKPDALGVIFEVKGEDYELIGAKPRSPRYPLIGKRVRDGKRFKFGVMVAAQIRTKYPRLRLRSGQTPAEIMGMK